MRFERWGILLYVFLGVMAAATVMFAAHGFSEDTLRGFLRFSARIAVLLFLMAFAASSLKYFFKLAWVEWVRYNRRYLGVSFAMVHFIHLGVLVLLGVYFPHPFLDRLTNTSLIGGGLAYLIILLMTITSFQPYKQWVGKEAWKVLHTVGSYYIWILFARSFVLRATQDVDHLFFATMVVAVMLLRILRRLGLATGRRGYA